MHSFSSTDGPAGREAGCTHNQECKRAGGSLPGAGDVVKGTARLPQLVEVAVAALGILRRQQGENHWLGHSGKPRALVSQPCITWPPLLWGPLGCRQKDDVGA